MSIVTKSISTFNEDVEEYLAKLNGSLTNQLMFVVKKYQTDEMKTYESKIVKKIMYSKNFKCYLFFLCFSNVERITMIDCFDVIGDVN